MNENQLRVDVIQLARSLRWQPYWTHYSPFSTAGWPDLALVRPPHLILAELKTDRGKVRPAQVQAQQLLERCERLEYHLWRPSDFDEIVERLGGHAQGRLV